jgi:DNA-binding Lrp family transcriptional regulator
LDDVDRAILRELVADGRISNTLLARRLGIAESTCAWRMRALREDGVLAGITARIDHAALGRTVEALVKVRLGHHDRDEVRRLFHRLTLVPGVLSVMHVAGIDDFVVHLAVESQSELRDLVLEHIVGHRVVRQTETQLIFETRRPPD